MHLQNGLLRQEEANVFLFVGLEPHRRGLWLDERSIRGRDREDGQLFVEWILVLHLVEVLLAFGALDGEGLVDLWLFSFNYYEERFDDLPRVKVNHIHPGPGVAMGSAH